MTTMINDDDDDDDDDDIRCICYLRAGKCCKVSQFRWERSRSSGSSR